MNCNNWEERITLYAGGDLESAEIAEIEKHLAECDGCRIFVGGMQESLQALRSAHEEPIAAGYYTAVRAGVLAHLATNRRAWWQRRWIYGLATAAAVLAIVLVLRVAEKPPAHLAKALPEPVTTARLVEEPPAILPARPQRILPRRRLAAVRHRLPGPPPLVDPIVVKLVTDDPDVIIYWIADKKGEEDQ